MLSIKLEAYRIHSQFHTFLRDVSLSRWTVHHCSGDLCVGTVVHSHRYPHPFRDSWAHEMGEDPNGTRCRERSQLLSYMVFVRMAVFLFLECQWSYSPPAAGRSWILEHCVCTYRQSLLRRTSAGELKEITDCDTSFSWKCYVNVFFLTRRGTPLVSHNKKPAKRSHPSVNQVLWWFCMWILWSSPRPMHPVSWLEASWFWCGEKGEGPPNNASFYS